MSHRAISKRRIVSPLIRQAVEAGEFIPLSQWLRERGMSRSSFYRHPEIPTVKDGRRVYVARAYEVRK